jgi:hypothetical protein
MTYQTTRHEKRTHNKRINFFIVVKPVSTNRKKGKSALKLNFITYT